MKQFLQMLTAVLLVPLSAFSQQRFHKQMPPGNYSGICALGDNRYAVVNDKSAEDGFHVFRINIDTIRGRITALSDEGFRSAHEPNTDMEAICLFPPAGTLFAASEKTGEVREYTLDGQPTQRSLPLKPLLGGYNPGSGIESLTYDARRHRFFTTTERPLKGDSLLTIMAFDDRLQLRETYRYQPDPPISRKYTQGVSELCVLDDGRLLVLERQIRVPRLKIGARTVVRLYEVELNGTVAKKHLLTELTTRLTLLGRKFANYEGMCQVADGWLLLVADSQNRYRHVLRDWLLLLPIAKKN